MSHIGRRRLALSVPIVSLPASLSVIAARSLSGVLLSAALLSASLSLSASPCLAQDAFGWGPGDGAVDTFSTGGYGYPATTVEGENYGDSFSSPGDGRPCAANSTRFRKSYPTVNWSTRPRASPTTPAWTCSTPPVAAGRCCSSQTR